MTVSINKERKEFNIENCLGQPCTVRREYLREANEKADLENQMLTLKQENEEIKGAMSDLFSIVNNLFSFLTGNIIKKIDTGTPVSFDDVIQIRKLSITLASNDNALQSLSNLLVRYLNEVKDRYLIDCIQELDKRDYKLSPNLKLYKNVDSDSPIERMLKAIVLYEYGRLLKLEGSRFIQGTIEYSDYISNMQRHAKNAGDAYSEQQS